VKQWRGFISSSSNRCSCLWGGPSPRETRAASASIARAQASLERAFILHTLEIRRRFQSGDQTMFLPNHLMVPWHAYVQCTQVLVGLYKLNPVCS
jgi:hypothetical protein